MFGKSLSLISKLQVIEKPRTLQAKMKSFFSPTKSWLKKRYFNWHFKTIAIILELCTVKLINSMKNQQLILNQLINNIIFLALKFHILIKRRRVYYCLIYKCYKWQSCLQKFSCWKSRLIHMLTHLSYLAAQ